MSRRALRLQVLVCPQLDFIGTADELKAGLDKDFEFNADRGHYVHAVDDQYTPIRPQIMVDGKLQEDPTAAPIDNAWRLVEDRRRLHVGETATKKLRGDGTNGDPFVDTVRSMYEGTDACQDLPDRLTVMIDEDWHPLRTMEFSIFGQHCVKGTDGARLPGDLEPYRRDPRTFVLRANSINPAANPEDYLAKVQAACAGEKPDYMKVGIFGVWTHVKVEYMAVALSTMAPYFSPGQIGICGSLCASRDAAEHAAGLAKLRGLGFQVFDDTDGKPGSGIQDYLEWFVSQDR